MRRAAKLRWTLFDFDRWDPTSFSVLQIIDNVIETAALNSCVSSQRLLKTDMGIASTINTSVRS